MKSAYMLYYGHQDINSDAVTTGKFRHLGGIRGRTEATGLGVFYVAKQILANIQLCERMKIKPGIKGKTFSVQGFGNVGYWASKFMVEEGAKLIAVA